ncbi:hypothetical protein BHE74_00022451 [Ensete ventricosum]|nr:hypothetical protein BHE74_00022451 [Ensete ventricosum]
MMPRPRAGRRGVDSFFRSKTRRRLVSSFPHGKARRRLIPARGDAQYCPIASGPCTDILSDWYILPVLGGTDRNREP